MIRLCHQEYGREVPETKNMSNFALRGDRVKLDRLPRALYVNLNARVTEFEEN